MVADSTAQNAVESDHTRWHDDHLSWAAEIQVWEHAIDAALFDVELALWNKQYAKLDRVVVHPDMENHYNLVVSPQRIH